MYDKSDVVYDPDSQKDDCNLPFSLCSEMRNKLTNPNNTIMAVRGIDGIQYYPDNEIELRRQYAIMLDVWHFDYGWQNMQLVVIFISTVIFVYSYQAISRFIISKQMIRNYESTPWSLADSHTPLEKMSNQDQERNQIEIADFDAAPRIDDSSKKVDIQEAHRSEELDLMQASNLKKEVDIYESNTSQNGLHIAPKQFDSKKHDFRIRDQIDHIDQVDQEER